MELAKAELNAIERAMDQVAEEQVRELNEIQLALVGGGIGEVILG